MTTEKDPTDNPESGRNRRKRDRLALNLPIRVTCRETLTSGWEEVTRLIDVTPFGAGFKISRPVKSGRLLCLTMPLPRPLRCYDHIEPQYRVWCLVRHVREQIKEGEKTIFTIGAAFIGKHPPTSFERDPTTVYEILAPNELGFWHLREVLPEKPVLVGEKSQTGNNEAKDDGRRVTRHPIPLTVRIDVFDENGETVSTEMTVTENINSHGALVLTTLTIERGRFVRLTSDQYNVSLTAVVRRRRVGEDGIARLHLEFIDKQFPLEEIG